MLNAAWIGLRREVELTIGDYVALDDGAKCSDLGMRCVCGSQGCIALRFFRSQTAICVKCVRIGSNINALRIIQATCGTSGEDAR